MTRYKLKKGIENFQIVDGPFAGRKFVRGKVYDEDRIPPGEKKKFEEIRDQKSKFRSQPKALSGVEGKSAKGPERSRREAKKL